MELKRCARCGKFYASEVEVCKECEKKDMADLSKLKGFFAENYISGVSKTEISASTGISARNLNRYLGYEEFSGIYISDTVNGVNGISGLNGIEDETLTEGKISL